MPPTRGGSMARFLVVLLFCVACGNIARQADDAGVTKDAPMPVIDAAVIDAEVLAPSPARDLVSGAARVTGPTYKFDVEIGHPVMQLKMNGATYQLEGNAAVKP